MAGVNRPLLFDVRAPIRAVVQLRFVARVATSPKRRFTNEPGQCSPGALVQRLVEVQRSMTERRSPRSGNIGLRARRRLREQGVEIDELRIVSLGFAEPCAAMKMHQGLHAAGVEMVHMLMLQRDR